MNKERVLILADTVRTQKLAKAGVLGFNMGTVMREGRQDYSGYNCGTVGCIIGHTIALFHPGGLAAFAVHEPVRDLCRDEYAAKLLGLDGDEYALSFELFQPPGWMTRAKEYTTDRVADVLEHLAETGEVVW